MGGVPSLVWEFRRRQQELIQDYARLEEALRRTRAEDVPGLAEADPRAAALWRQDRAALARQTATDEAANTRWVAGVAVLAAETAVEMTAGRLLTGWPLSLVNETSRLAGLPECLLDWAGADLRRCRRQEALDRKARLLGRLVNARAQALRNLRQEFAARLDGYFAEGLAVETGERETSPEVAEVWEREALLA